VREIEFRGKRVDTGEWVYGAFVPDALETPDNDLITWGFIRRYNRDIGKMETIEVARESVGQYTGLCDKNGQKIYEGDVLHIEIHNWAKKDDILSSANEVVKFQNGKFGFDWGFRREFKTMDCFCETTFEIIGNAHDNPDLLNGEATT
jgi:uncharacterized phage protein (TIGR01671 family)